MAGEEAHGQGMACQKHREKERKRVKAYYVAHPEKKRESWRKFSVRHGIDRRPVERLRHAIKAVMKRGSYRPCYNRRKPDWVPVGKSGIDPASQFLVVNLTVSQKAWLREISSR